MKNMEIFVDLAGVCWHCKIAWHSKQAILHYQISSLLPVKTISVTYDPSGTALDGKKGYQYAGLFP